MNKKILLMSVMAFFLVLTISFSLACTNGDKQYYTCGAMKANCINGSWVEINYFIDPCLFHQNQTACTILSCQNSEKLPTCTGYWESVKGNEPNCNCTWRCDGDVTCTMDVKVCPDGSTVGKNPNNNCEFYECSTKENQSVLNKTIFSIGSFNVPLWLLLVAILILIIFLISRK